MNRSLSHFLLGKTPEQKSQSVVGLIIAAAVIAILYTSCKPVWQFTHLERNAKKVITATELQSFSTNLLARHPSETNLAISELGTNFPIKMLSLAPKIGPGHVYVHVYETSNSPPYVQFSWGSGFLGSAGFCVGATNFFMEGKDVHQWQPGVYFYQNL